MTLRSGRGDYLINAFDRADEPSLCKKPFIVSSEGTVTFGEAADKTKRLTRLYRDAGIVPGDRVMIATRNELDGPVIFLSLLRNGITAVNIDPDMKPHRFIRLAQAAHPKGIILDADLADQWKPRDMDFVIKIKNTGGRGSSALFRTLLKRQPQGDAIRNVYPDVLKDHPPAEGPETVDPESDAYILFTSGTTSDPKGVRISHRNLSTHLDTLSSQFGYSRESRILNILILSHADGIIQGPVVAFVNGATLFRPMRFDINRLGALLDSIYADRITHFVAVPAMLSLIERLCRDRADAFQTDDFRFIISTGAYLDAGLWRRFEDFFLTRIANVYGLTETVVGSLFSGPSDEDHCIGTIGRPVDCEALIADENGIETTTGVAGELLLRGDNVMTGYFNSPDATSRIFRDGWLLTGDIAVRDEKGLYRITGRKKNIIISGGINIHPEEITEVLKLSPSVTEAVTFGMPDEIWGERLVSAVSLDAAESATEEDLIAFCRAHLEETKVPADIHILPALPKGPVGKVQIEKVKEIISLSDRTEKALGGDLQSSIITLAAHCFKVRPQDLTMDMAQNITEGWDSLAHLELIAALEEQFQIVFSPVEIMQIESLRDAWNIVAEKLR